MGSSKFAPELIAPCGMNCGICRVYNVYTHGVPTKRGKVTHCEGCRPRAKNCYVIRACSKLRKNQIQSCSECDTMPCEKVSHLDKCYCEHYDMSKVENLKKIKVKAWMIFLLNKLRSTDVQIMETLFLCMTENAIRAVIQLRILNQKVLKKQDNYQPRSSWASNRAGWAKRVLKHPLTLRK